MKFSIIIPVYNAEKYLRECVVSIEEQTEISSELLLIDDGSTDGSGSLCDELAKEYLNIIVKHTVNGGASVARNEGIKIATGEYILFVDSDDYIANNSLLKIWETIEKNDYPDLVCLELIKFSDNTHVQVKMHDGIDKSINDMRGDEIYYYLSQCPKYPASPCTKAIKRIMFQENELSFIPKLLAEDLEWSVRLFLACKSVAYCSSDYYYYRQSDVSSASNIIQEKGIFDILSTFSKWTQSASTEENLAKRAMICSFMEYIVRLLILRFDRISNEKRELFIEEIKKGSWVLGTRRDKTSRIIALTYKLLGMSVTSKLLKKYLSIRGM